MQVEVSVQDYFYELLADNPIAVETWESWFYDWLEILQPNLSPVESYELSLRLTDNVEIQKLNAQYRQQNQPTDVLAFAALEVDFPQTDEMRSPLPLYLGDIVISIDKAQQQALERGHNLLTELAWLASHGLLHLLGWDHPDEDSLIKMLNQQALLLQSLNIVINTV